MALLRKLLERVRPPRQMKVSKDGDAASPHRGVVTSGTAGEKALDRQTAHEPKKLD